MAKRRKKKPCSITFHLPKEDIMLNFDYHEFIPAGRGARHQYIYFEHSKDVLGKSYERWHQQVFEINRKRKPQPCDVTVRLYDDERDNIIEVFRLTGVLPERSVIGPKDDKKPEDRVIEFVDYKYLEKIAIEDNIQTNDNDEEINNYIGDSGTCGDGTSRTCSAG